MRYCFLLNRKAIKIQLQLLLMIIILSTHPAPVSSNESNSNITKEISITYNFDTSKALISNKTYTNIVKIENENHQSGITDNLDLTLTHSLNSTIIHQSNHTINKFTSTNTGNITLLEKETKILCTQIKGNNFYNNGTKNQCINISTSTQENPPTTPKNEQCACPLTISLDKKITQDKIKIQLDHCKNSSSKYSNEIEYWVEDLNSNIVKSKLSTTNTAQKTFTPKTNLLQETYRVFAQVDACDLQTQEIFTKTNLDSQNKKENTPYLNISAPEISESSIVLINIKGYKNTNHRVFKAYIEKDKKRVSEITRMTIHDDEFNLEIPLALTDRESGMHKVVVEGMGQIKTERIYIQGKPKKIPEPLRPKIKNVIQKNELFTGIATLKINFENTYSAPLEIKSSNESSTHLITTNTYETNISINHPKEIIALKLFNANGNLEDLSYIQLNYYKIKENQKNNLSSNEVCKTNQNLSNEKINSTALIGTGLVASLILIIYLDTRHKGN